MIETKMKNIYQLCLQLETYSKAGTPMKYIRKRVNASGDLIVDPYLKNSFFAPVFCNLREGSRERGEKKKKALNPHFNFFQFSLSFIVSAAT